MRIDVLNNITQYEYIFYVFRNKSDVIVMDSSVLYDLEKNNWQIPEFDKQVMGICSNGF